MVLGSSYFCRHSSRAALAGWRRRSRPSRFFAFDRRGNDSDHARIELMSGSDHPGSVSSGADSPATAFAYEYGLGGLGRMLTAGQFSYEGGSQSGGFVTQWLPSR